MLENRPSRFKRKTIQHRAPGQGRKGYADRGGTHGINSHCAKYAGGNRSSVFGVFGRSDHAVVVGLSSGNVSALILNTSCYPIPRQTPLGGFSKEYPYHHRLVASRLEEE